MRRQFVMLPAGGSTCVLTDCHVSACSHTYSVYYQVWTELKEDEYEPSISLRWFFCFVSSLTDRHFLQFLQKQKHKNVTKIELKQTSSWNDLVVFAETSVAHIHCGDVDARGYSRCLFCEIGTHTYELIYFVSLQNIISCCEIFGSAPHRWTWLLQPSVCEILPKRDRPKQITVITDILSCQHSHSLPDWWLLPGT